jgi:hypothetical protein
MVINRTVFFQASTKFQDLYKDDRTKYLSSNRENMRTYIFIIGSGSEDMAYIHSLWFSLEYATTT